MRRLALLLIVLALACAREAEAQGRPLRVQVATSLNFGDLLPGVPTTVVTNDPLNAGEFDLRGRKNTDILVEFILPPDLTGPGGAAVTLIFGPGSAGYSMTANIAQQMLFDPGSPQAFTLPGGNGRASVFLGGTAVPPSGLPAGSYTNTVTLQVGYLGN